MPHMNGTGPEGKGSATGRGMGKCKKPQKKKPCRSLAKDQANAVRQEVEPEKGNA